VRRLDDDRLIERTLAGDSDAFAELIRRYEQPLAALICRLVSNAHDREDVLQRTLLDVWRCLAQLRDRSKVKAWLIQIARNRCRDHYRGAAPRDEPTPDDALEIYLNRFGRTVGQPPSLEAARDAVEQVPPTQRQTAELFYLEGLTIKEISRRLHTPAGTIKRRLFHARRALEQSLTSHTTRNTKEKT
jgi:RNA polymerase sigma-70 factor (ECF subfamily)